MSEFQINNSKHVKTNIHLQSSESYAQSTKLNSLWQKGFTPNENFKGLMLEKADTPFSIIVNTPVNKKELAEFIQETGIEPQWSDDFAEAVKTQNELAVLKELASLKNKNGERLYDSFQLYQFTGKHSAKKLDLAKKFYKENPEFTNNVYNGFLINYMVNNNISKADEAYYIKHALLANKIRSVNSVNLEDKRLTALLQAADGNEKIQNASLKAFASISELNDNQFQQLLNKIKLEGDADTQQIKTEENFSVNLALINLVKDKELQTSLNKINITLRNSPEELRKIKEITVGLTNFNGDAKVLSEIKKELLEIANSNEKLTEKADRIKLLEKIVNFNNYVNDGSEIFQTREQKYILKELQTKYHDYKTVLQVKNIQKIKEMPDALISNRAQDFLEQVKLAPLKEFISENANDEFSDYLYENYYLKNQPKAAQPLLNQINSKYGTKVFLADIDKEFDIQESLKYIDKELAKWQKASSGRAVLPKTLDMNSMDYHFINNNTVIGYAANSKYHKDFNNDIKIKTAANLEKTLRHELTHLNDTKAGTNEDFMPDEDLIRKELSGAGLSEGLIDYALKSRDELVAVAAEGNPDYYSEQFKETLINLGLPDWLFKLYDAGQNSPKYSF